LSRSSQLKFEVGAGCLLVAWSKEGF